MKYEFLKPLSVHEVTDVRYEVLFQKYPWLGTPDINKQGLSILTTTKNQGLSEQLYSYTIADTKMT